MSSTAVSATIIPFPTARRPGNRMSFHDRIVALKWQDEAAVGLGYVRVCLDTGTSPDAPDIGDFMLIYRAEKSWAEWAVGREDGAFIVWRPGDGVTVGQYPTLALALASVPPAL